MLPPHLRTKIASYPTRSDIRSVAALPKKKEGSYDIRAKVILLSLILRRAATPEPFPCNVCSWSPPGK